MGLAGGDTKRNIEAIALFALFLSFSSFSFINLVTRPVACFPGDIGFIKCPLQPGTHDTTALGTWLNMPSALTEFMGNRSFRQVFYARSVIAAAGLQADLTVNCTNPSNTPGAYLQLQYANFSATTNTNTSNFAILSGIGNVARVPIDNSVNNPCPGFLVSSLAGLLPNLNNQKSVYIFRVVGSGGGGSGDNPRFSSVSIVMHQIVIREIMWLPTSVTTTGFTAQAYLLIQATNSAIVNANWLATNTTSLGTAFIESGTTTCTINEPTPPTAAVPTCNQAIVFATPFVTAPEVFLTGTSQPGSITLTVASITILGVPTVTL